MKNAVLGLIVERRGYGYDLIRRFNDRFGAAWNLNQSTVYAAIDDLYEGGLVRAIDGSGIAASGASGAGAPRRSRKVIYEATHEGRERFLTWLTAPIGKVEPVRSEIYLKIALATQEHALALLQVIDAHIDACTNMLAERLAGYELDAGGAREVSWAIAAGYFINDAGLGRLQGDLAWLRRVRAGVEALRVHGVVPISMLAPMAGLPPGWR
ncbi:MAG TPA: PadR family transcriptional regulator [Conexibacter sp.]|jgi:DNA-binding PadR family transcriptional regulator|nr:PadR family transcriptional regulator [Conexibacter sp.]